MTLLPPSYVPRRSRTIHAEILNDEICIYDWTTRRVHALNATAARVWELCDGVTSVAQIADRLHADLSVAHVDDVVSLAVAEFSEAGLLEGPRPAGRLALSRRDIVKRLGLTAAMLPVVSSIAAPSALQAQSQNTQVFFFTGAPRTFVVPGGVTQITVHAYGAAGGRGSLSSGPWLELGLGGHVTATIPVTAAETLTVYVGNLGSYSYVPPNPLYGFNGGGTGNGNGFTGGGGGGGASDVRRGTTRLVVAGGGGGGAGTGGVAGLGGGMTGGAGGSNSLTGAGGGGGGTQGAGGIGGGAGPGGGAGTPGASGTGGSGGDGGGAGGGGGYFGGGGGGGTRTGDHPFEGGGGGGGSSYTDPAATFVTHRQGYQGGLVGGYGRVHISW